jgi:hypothetical protein
LRGERRARSDLVAAVDEGEVRYWVEGLEEIGNDVGSIKLGVNRLYLESCIVLGECKREKSDEGGNSGEHPGDAGGGEIQMLEGTCRGLAGTPRPVALCTASLPPAVSREISLCEFL